MDKIKQLTSENIVNTNIEKLKQLFPTAFKEGKVVMEELQALLGDYVEKEKEFYEFNWAGKTMARMEANKPSTGTLRPCKEESKNWDTTENIFIEGDNLEVLKLMQKTYSNRIKMIYIDPPYNTGKDFVYKDNYKDNLDHYLQITGQTDEEGKKLSANTESDGRYHSNWLNMMYPRLKLARNLLTDDGVIFISIDDNEQSNLKKLCDEIFGEENNLSVFIRKSKSITSAEKSGINNQHEYCLIYCKAYKDFLLKGEPKSSERYSNPDNDPRGIWVSSDPTAPRDNDRYEIKNPITGQIDVPPLGRSWFFSKNTMQKYIDSGQLVFKKEFKKGERGFIFKRYFNELINNFNLIDSLLFVDSEYFNEKGTKEVISIFQNKIFDAPKPLSFLKKIIKYSTSNDSLILDFFAGSGTTAHAVMALNAEDGGNRKCISVQLPEPTDEKSEAYKAGYKNIAEIAKERIRRAGEKVKEDNADKENIDKLDVGFRVFKLDSSNIKRWDTTPENFESQVDLFEDALKEDRSEEDVLYEILLKYGLDLTVPIQEKEVEGCTIHNIGFGALYVCLAQNISPKVATAIAEWNKEDETKYPSVIFRDNGFKTDADKTNAVQTLKQFGIENVRSI